MEKISIARRRWEKQDSPLSVETDTEIFSRRTDAQASNGKTFHLDSLGTFLIEKFNILQTGKKQFTVEIVSGLEKAPQKLLVSLEPLTQESSAKDYISVEEAAQTLQVAKKTIYRQLQEGSLQGMRVGRKWLVSLNSLNSLNSSNIAES